MPPVPKPAGERVRRNADQPGHRVVTRGVVEVPSMPAQPGLDAETRKVAKAYWRAVWNDLGELFTESDRYGLGRMAGLHAAVVSGQATPQDASELRQLETAYGVGPAARRKLMIVIVDPPEQTADAGVADLDAARRDRRERLSNQAP